MPGLVQRMTEYFKSLTPTDQKTRWNPRYQYQPVAAFCDVERVQNIIRGAEIGNTRELFALYRDVLLSDSHLQSQFNIRKMAILGDPINLKPVDKTNAEDVAARDACNQLVLNCDDWFDACSHLLDSVLWPVALVEKVYRPGQTQGLRFELSRLIPVPDQLLNYSTPDGRMTIWDTDPDSGAQLASHHDPIGSQYIVHRGHLLSTADNWGGPMRSLLFWWLLRTMDTNWWARFLERFNGAFMLGKYTAGDDASREVLERAFDLSMKLGGLVVTKETEVDIKQAVAGGTVDGFERFHLICNREMSKLVLGQSLASEAQSTGMGSGVAAGQEGVRQDQRQLDGIKLSATFRSQLFKQFLWANGIPGRPPLVTWGAESYAESEQTGKLLVSLEQSGLQPSDEALPVISQRIGFEVERKPAAPAPEPQMPFAPAKMALASTGSPSAIHPGVTAVDSIASKGAAPLAQAFRGTFAPIRRIILESKTPEEAEGRIRTLYADFGEDRLRPVIDAATDAMRACGANGAVAGAKGG